MKKQGGYFKCACHRTGLESLVLRRRTVRHLRRHGWTHSNPFTAKIALHQIATRGDLLDNSLSRKCSVSLIFVDPCGNPFRIALLFFGTATMNSMTEFGKRICNAWRRHGWRRLGPLLVYNVQYHGKRLLSKDFKAQQMCSADQIPGVETYRLVTLSTLGVVNANSKGAQPYQPISERAFDTIVRSLPIEPSEMAFVDLGSGKGRALLLASKAGFQKIIGVEFSEKLHLDALRNLQAARDHWPHVERIELVHGDAMVYDPPAMGVVLFLYNPFDASVMAPVIERWCAAMQQHSHPVWVVYVQPSHVSLFETNPCFKVFSADAGTAIFSR